MKHFHARVLGSELIVRSDSLALVNAVKNDLKDQLPSEQRYLQNLKEYDPEIIHIPGSENHVADALSRPPQITSMYFRRYESDSDYEEILDSKSEVEEELQYEFVDDDEEVIGQESLNRESIATLQRNEPNLIETALSLKKRLSFFNQKT